MSLKLKALPYALAFIFGALPLLSHADTQPAPAAQHTLKLAIGEEPTEGFDPLLGWSHGSYLLLHSPLLKQKSDLSWDNLLTEKVTNSEDGKTWTLTLKPDLKFSDGSPLTAKDVAFTYNQAARGGGKIDMGNFASAKALDSHRVEITLSAPQSTFVNVLGSLALFLQKNMMLKPTHRSLSARALIDWSVLNQVNNSSLKRTRITPVTKMILIN